MIEYGIKFRIMRLYGVWSYFKHNNGLVMALFSNLHFKASRKKAENSTMCFRLNMIAGVLDKQSLFNV